MEGVRIERAADAAAVAAAEATDPPPAVTANATLTPEGWLVHLEGDSKDKAGKPIPYVIDGKIENLGLPHRAITGTWKAGTESGPFKISRQ